MAIERKKTKVKMNQPVYLGISILDISKTLMYKFWYDYIKLKYLLLNKACTAEPYSFLVNDARLASDNPLRFRKNLLNI